MPGPHETAAAGDPRNDAWRAALLESSLDCVIVMDGAGLIVDVNRITEETFGHQRTSIVGRRLAEVFVPPELREAHERGLARYLQTGASNILGSRVEVPALHADGHRISIELAIARLHHAGPPLFVGHLRPIEEQQRRERRLRASAAASQAMAESATAVEATAGMLRAIGEQLKWSVVQFWRVTSSTSIELTSYWVDPDIDGGACQTATAFAPGVGLPGGVWQSGRPLWIEDIREAVHLTRVHRLAAAGFASAVGIPVHVRNRVAGVIEAFAATRETEDPQLIALLEALAGQLGHFIEEFAAGEALSRSEARLLVALQREQDARHAAEEANRTKDHLLAVVSHELRTPLGPIIGWARMLQATTVTPELLARALPAIERNAMLQARLVDDLLDMSRTVTGKLTLQNGLVDVETVVHAAIDTHRTAASAKSLHLDIDAEGNLPAIPGDASRLQQVVSNLLANAIKFTPNYGRITIATRRTAEGIELRVSDTGAGIDPALLPSVFEPFRQGHSSTSGEGGLGLGLAIVSALVQAHGGTVEAASAGTGAGSTFIVRLPAQQPPDRLNA